MGVYGYQKVLNFIATRKTVYTGYKVTMDDFMKQQFPGVNCLCFGVDRVESCGMQGLKRLVSGKH